jgi:hypothetical protein
MVQGHHIGWIRGPPFSNEHKPDVLVKFVVNGLQGGVSARADLKQIGNHTADGSGKLRIFVLDDVEIHRHLIVVDLFQFSHQFMGVFILFEQRLE